MNRAELLAELKALPLPTVADITPEGIEWEIGGHRGTIPADYLRHFVVPHDSAHGNPLCIGCGAILVGAFGLWGSFEWSIAWGAFRCSACRWPGRLYHELKADDDTVITASILWQMHPDDVSLPEQAGAA